MTEAQRAAIEWLRKRGGDGVFQRVLSRDPELAAQGKRFNALLARGELAPFMWSTILKLVELGHLEEYQAGKARRFRIARAA